MKKGGKSELELNFLSKELQNKLSPDQIHHSAKKTKFIQRDTKFKPEFFLMLCAFIGCVGEKTLTELCAKVSAMFGVQMTTEGLNQRFNSRGVQFLIQVFKELFMNQLNHDVGSLPYHLFNSIRILDSTSFDLPGTYSKYIGPNGSGVKLQLEYELLRGKFLHLFVQNGKENDSKYPKMIKDDIQPNDLCLRDLGYFSADNLKDIHKQQAFFISRITNVTNIYQKNEVGKWEKVDYLSLAADLNPGEVIELVNVRIGANKKEPLIARVVIFKLTEEQQKQRQKHIDKKKKKGKKALSAQKKISVNTLATNIPQETVKMEEIYRLYSLRWQIEILFKTWKSLFEIHKVKEIKEERFECHLYGTLIRILLCSTLAFQCRRMLYFKNQIETSEYTSISIVLESISELPSIIVKKPGDFTIWLKNVYENIKTNGRKCRRKQKQTVFDILDIAYETIAS